MRPSINITKQFVCVPLVSAMMLISLQTVACAAEPLNLSADDVKSGQIEGNNPTEIQSINNALNKLSNATVTNADTVNAKTPVADFKNFTITDIKISGLGRITEDSLFAILPVTIGDTLNQPLLAQSIATLYNTGNFSNIQAHINGNQLIFEVVERPIIAEVNFEGNKLIPIDSLREGLKNANLAVGSILKQSTVQGVANELQQQYISQGYYNSDIEVEQTLLDGNRVKLDLRFIEGSAARVVDINVIGNQYFDDEAIADVFAIKQASWTQVFSKSDRYAQEKLAASLENLKALYTNEGFINFTIDDAILNISEDKQSIFIEVSVTEGEQYKFGEVNFLGNPSYQVSTLREDVSFKPGEQYSQRQLDLTTAALTRRYGNDGYYLAQIRPVTRLNEDLKTVNIDYYIDPSRPVYVRRINFTGNFKTADEVLRREMRQLESSLASNEKIQRSKARLMRTGYFKSVNTSIHPVPNLPDQIDLEFVVEEQASGTSTIAAGYSQSGGVTFQLDLSQRNFLGTGNRVNAALSRSETYDSYSLGYVNPYFTANGVSQGLSGYYKSTKYDDKNVSNYVKDSYGATLNYSYPIDERQRISAGFNYDNTEVRGGRFMGISNVNQLLEDGGKSKSYTGEDTGRTSFKNDYDTYNLLLGWDYSTLDRPVFPTRGMSHSIDGTIGLGDNSFQKVVYRGNIYYPIYKDFITRGYAKAGYGNDLPFYENFYAGGYGSVRGFDPSSLGPRSTTFYDTTVDSSYVSEEVGGNALLSFGTELILPMPFKGDWADQVRPVLFVEGGQVIDTSDNEDKTFIYDYDEDGVATDTGIPLITQDKDLRFSAGAGMTWYTPIGPISISYAVPLNDKDTDSTDEVQFQIGSTF